MDISSIDVTVSGTSDVPVLLDLDDDEEDELEIIDDPNKQMCGSKRNLSPLKDNCSSHKKAKH